MEPYIVNIQKYSLHDGKGIRTTVFFKGCPLSCLWCHNPETQCFDKQLLYDRERCIGCASCVPSCPVRAIEPEAGKVRTNEEMCGLCGSCENSCPLGLRQLAGRSYPPALLLELLKQDQIFYEQSEGGVTLSGGEVMAQDMNYLAELLKGLFREGLSVNIDTCGYAPFENFTHILPFVDTFLYDLKLMNPEKHREFTGVDNRLILGNLIRLSRAGARIAIRIPVISGVNASLSEMGEISRWLLHNHIHTQQINLLPYHNTGSGKYARLSTAYKGVDFSTPDKEMLNKIAQQFNQDGFSNVTWN